MMSETLPECVNSSSLIKSILRCLVLFLIYWYLKIISLHFDKTAVILNFNPLSARPFATS